MAHISKRTLPEIGLCHNQYGFIIGQVLLYDDRAFGKPRKQGGIVAIVTAQNDIFPVLVMPEDNGEQDAELTDTLHHVGKLLSLIQPELVVGERLHPGKVHFQDACRFRGFSLCR